MGSAGRGRRSRDLESLACAREKRCITAAFCCQHHQHHAFGLASGGDRSSTAHVCGQRRRPLNVSTNSVC